MTEVISKNGLFMVRHCSDLGLKLRQYVLGNLLIDTLLAIHFSKCSSLLLNLPQFDQLHLLSFLADLLFSLLLVFILLLGLELILLDLTLFEFFLAVLIAEVVVRIGLR